MAELLIKVVAEAAGTSCQALSEAGPSFHRYIPWPKGYSCQPAPESSSSV